MSEPPVVNASPLIFLARGGELDLLLLLGSECVVPRRVAEEILRRGESDVTARSIGAAPWLLIVEPAPIPPLIQAWDLGPGESAVLAWALARPGTVAVVDDLAARRCAAALGISVRGTLGLVLLAKQRGRVSLARPVLDRLRGAGMYLSNRVLDEALALVGE